MECIFVEMKPFTRKLVRLGLDDELARVQVELRRRCGPRTAFPGHAHDHASGARAARTYLAPPRPPADCYAFVPLDEAIYLFSIYRKDEQLALTMEQKRDLCRILRSWGAE